MVNVYSVCNSRISVFRAGTVSEFGDPVDIDTGMPLLTGLAAQINETEQIVTDPNSQTPRVIRQVTAKVSSRTPMQIGDRIRNDRTGAVYAVREVTNPNAIGFIPDTDLVLQKIG